MSTEEPLEKTIESQENKNEEIEEKVLSKINKTLLLFISIKSINNGSKKLKLNHKYLEKQLIYMIIYLYFLK